MHFLDAVQGRFCVDGVKGGLQKEKVHAPFHEGPGMGGIGHQAGLAVLQRDSIPAVVSYIGDGFNQMGQADSALWYYRRSLALKPRNETTLSKVMGILLGKGDFDGAISMAEPFLSEDPDNVTIAPLKGLALYSKGDYEPAVKVFQR